MRHPTPPPAQWLAALCQDGAAPQLTLLTGGRGSGKTRWCLHLLAQARASGIAVAGVVSPPVYTAGHKTGIDLQDVASGACRRLAERPAPGESGTAGLGWRFDPQALRWGNMLLAQLPPCDVLLIDELGPLEFRGEGGFLAGFQAIAAQQYRLALVVVRPELIDIARERWPGFNHLYTMEAP